MKHMITTIAKTILIGGAALTGILFFGQHKIIWFPRPYDADYKTELPAHAVELDYTTSQGKQCAFYLPPRDGSAAAPERVWVLFCGNGSLALDWTNWLSANPNKRDGFLLIDYPGFGLCQGSAEPANIEESADAALVALQSHLGMKTAELDSRLDVLAHSIGTGAGLQFAAHHPVKQVILLSPFTSLRDMAKRVVGWPLCYMLRNNFDNRARLAELAARSSPPQVTIFHGSADEVVPVKMGRTLGAEFPSIATFHEIPGATHNDIAYAAQAQIFSVMNGSGK